MLDFKPITKELLIREGRSLRRSRIQICDYTPGCLYIWRHYYHMRCAEADGMFIFESGDGSGLYYNCPEARVIFPLPCLKRAMMPKNEAFLCVFPAFLWNTLM